MGNGINVDVRSNLSFLTKNLDEYQKNHVPFVTAFALTKTAQEIQRALYDEMAAVFDRPTRFTLNSLYVKPATKKLQIASVEFKEGFGSIPAWRYLRPQVEGGPRVKKSHERALERAGLLKPDEFVVPGRLVDLDGNGNMKGSQITRILSDVQANSDPLSNSTRKTRVARRKRGGGAYFLVRGRKIPNGIYFRLGLRDIRPILIFVRQPQYTKRLPFHEVAQRTFDQRFAANFNVGMVRYGAPRSIPRVA
jgi:hypothetical protein